jgi:hypothetical protein
MRRMVLAIVLVSMSSGCALPARPEVPYKSSERMIHADLQQIRAVLAERPACPCGCCAAPRAVSGSSSGSGR